MSREEGMMVKFEEMEKLVTEMKKEKIRKGNLQLRKVKSKGNKSFHQTNCS